MAAASRRKAIIQAFRDRVQLILTSNVAENGTAFNTNAGAQVFVNETPELGEDDPDVAIAILIRDDVPGWNGEHVYIQLPIDVEAVAKADLDDPFLAVEDVLEDIKKAIETSDRTMGGTVKRQIERGPTRTVARTTGATTVGVAIRYTAPYTEQWGRP